MLKLKKSLTSMDISFIVQELQDLVGSWIDNIYEVKGRYFLKLRGAKRGKSMLLFDPPQRVHLTEYKRDFPQTPSEKALSLRKHIRDGRIVDIVQYGRDRIVILEIERGDRKFRLISEIFAKGNMILIEELEAVKLDKQNRVLFALWYKRLRNRLIVPGKEYSFPTPRGQPLESLFSTDPGELVEINEEEKNDIVRHLVYTYSMSGEIAEETLARSEINKTTETRKLDQSQWKKIIETIKQIISSKIQPQIIYKDKKPINVTPFPYSSVTGERKNFDEMNQAVDEYFAYYEEHRGYTDYHTKIKQLKELIKKQHEHINNIKQRSQKMKEKGDLIYRYLPQIKELLFTINKAVKNNTPWDEIITKLTIGKEKGIPAATLFDSIQPHNKLLTLDLDGKKITLDFTEKITKAANELYQKSKKLESKIKPAKEIIREKKKQLDIISQKQVEIDKKSEIKLKRHDKKWYERFHWLKTKNGFLVIAGRNARSNEKIVRSYLQKDDIFFHADLHGAPYTLLLVREQSRSDIEEIDLKQAAKLATSYSSAWDAGYTAADAYYVDADQVSFSAPSGESLARGSIMVRGKREYIKNIPLELCIGIVIEEKSAYVITGDQKFVSNETKYWKAIKPGKTKRSDIAKTIKKVLLKKVERKTEVLIESIDINALIRAVPGPSTVIFD